jgi:hypothetical protein
VSFDCLRPAWVRTLLAFSSMTNIQLWFQLKERSARRPENHCYPQWLPELNTGTARNETPKLLNVPTKPLGVLRFCWAKPNRRSSTTKGLNQGYRRKPSRGAFRCFKKQATISPSRRGLLAQTTISLAQEPFHSRSKANFSPQSPFKCYHLKGLRFDCGP